MSDKEGGDERFKMIHFSDALHLDPCRYCRVIEKRSAMVPVKRLPGKNPKSRGWACYRCATIRRYTGRKPPDAP